MVLAHLFTLYKGLKSLDKVFSKASLSFFFNSFLCYSNIISTVSCILSRLLLQCTRSSSQVNIYWGKKKSLKFFFSTIKLFHKVSFKSQLCADSVFTISHLHSPINMSLNTYFFQGVWTYRVHNQSSYDIFSLLSGFTF